MTRRIRKWFSPIICYDKRLAKNVQPYGPKSCYVQKSTNVVIIFLVYFFKKKNQVTSIRNASQKLFNTLKCPTSCTLIIAMRRSSNFFPGEGGIWVCRGGADGARHILGITVQCIYLRNLKFPGGGGGLDPCRTVMHFNLYHCNGSTAKKAREDFIASRTQCHT